MDEPDRVAEDAILDGRVRLLQPRRGHRAGTDAVLLAAAAPAGQGDRVADLGSGSGAVGLMIAARAPGCRILFVERDPTLADLCRRNVALNGLDTCADVVAADLLAPGRERRQAGLVPGSCDIVATNPPFLDAASARPSPDDGRAAAHHMPGGGLAVWIAAAAALLKTGGRVVMIHRADRLQDCLAAMAGFGGTGVLAVHGKADGPAVRILVSGIKGSRAPGSIRPALVLHDAAGRFTPAADALHSGAMDLAWT